MASFISLLLALGDAIRSHQSGVVSLQLPASCVSLCCPHEVVPSARVYSRVCHPSRSSFTFMNDSPADFVYNAGGGSEFTLMGVT